MHQHAKLDDRGRGLEVAEGVLAHFPKLTALPGHLKVGSADITRRDRQPHAMRTWPQIPSAKPTPTSPGLSLTRWRLDNDRVRAGHVTMREPC
jgi:hypothetical protein